MADVICTVFTMERYQFVRGLAANRTGFRCPVVVAAFHAADGANSGVGIPVVIAFFMTGRALSCAIPRMNMKLRMPANGTGI